MTTIRNKKKSTISNSHFDSVKMMREIRDKISNETADMNFQELKEYIESRIKSSGTKPIGK